MKRDYENIYQNIERIIHKYNQVENRKRCYGLEAPLSCTEIHMIDEIGKFPGIGVKEIASHKGVTEGAVSQLIKKLIEKKLIRKEISKESEAKVNLTLTENGMVCFEEHKKYHEQENKRWNELFDELTDQEYKKIEHILTAAEKMMG